MTTHLSFNGDADAVAVADADAGFLTGDKRATFIYGVLTQGAPSRGQQQSPKKSVRVPVKIKKFKTDTQGTSCSKGESQSKCQINVSNEQKDLLKIVDFDLTAIKESPTHKEEKNPKKNPEKITNIIQMQFNLFWLKSTTGFVVVRNIF